MTKAEAMCALDLNNEGNESDNEVEDASVLFGCL
jgi:hypothetical protein